MSRVHAQEKVTLQLKWTHAFQFAGYYAAIEKGYYQDAGLDVTIKEANPETDPVSEVLEGKAQYAVGSSGLLLSRAAGKPVVVLAVIFQHSPYEIYTSNEINNLRQFKGKRMMIEPQSEEIIAFLKKEGIPLDSLKLVPHTFSADALINSQTEAMSGYISSEPYFFRSAGFAYKTFSPRTAGIDFYGDNLFTSEQELSNYPARVKAFREASLKGWLYAKDHRDEIIDLIYNKYSKNHPPDYLRFESEQMIPLLQPDLVDIGYMNQNRWNHIARTYASIGLLTRDYPVEDFIYKPSERNLKGLYLSLGLAILIIFSISMITFYIFKVNRKLAMSIKKIKHADEILAESEKSFHVLFNSVTDAIYIQDENGYFIDVNVGAEKMYGISRNEIIGHTPEFLSAPGLNDLPKISELIKKTFNTGQPQLFEFWGKRKNREIFPKEVICNKGRHFGKDVIITTAREVTERKRTEAELHKTNALYNDLVRLIPVGIYRMYIKADGTLSFEYGSEKFCKMLNLDIKEVLKNPEAVLGTIHPDDRASIDEANRQAAKYMQPFRWEGRSRINGENGWLRIESEPTILPNGDSLWNGVIFDITNQKQVEETLRKSETKFRSYFELPLIGIAVTSPDKGWIEANKGIINMFGYSMDELAKLTWAELTHPDDLDTDIEEFNKLLMDQKNTYFLEKRFIHKNGNIIWTKLSVGCVRKPDRTVDYTVALIQDISERKKAEQEIKFKNEKLSELNATKDRFFSIIAHDLKNPFNSILGFSELLKDEAHNLDIDSIIQYSGIIHSSAQHTYDLLESLLKWARMQQGRIPYEPCTLLLNDLIDYVIEGQKIYADHKNIQLSNEIHENLIVLADENMISTVVRNLISNAIKFTPKNGKVVLSAKIMDGYVEISVTDTGVGMSTDALSKLFKIETSFSTRGTENEKGTGLGLLLCKEFIEKHKGKIWVESYPDSPPDSYLGGEGKGSKFIFTLKNEQI